jgi:hypothetical protein
MGAGTNSENTASGVKCKNCGGMNTNNFCADCGQEVFHQRFTVKKLFREWASAFYNYSGGILFTIKSLALTPGEAIRSYVGGNTISYWNPFNFFVITFSGYLLLSIKFGILSSESDYEKFTNDYAGYLMIFTIPFVSLFSFILFKKSGYNFGENLVLNVFIISQTNIYNIFLLVLYAFLSDKTAGLITIFIGFLYEIWVYKSFFQNGIIPVTLKVIVINIVKLVVLIVLLVISYVFSKFI